MQSNKSEKMTTYTPSQLVNVEWKPCTKFCFDGILTCQDEKCSKKTGIPMWEPHGHICKHCSGTGNEPVEMENPVISCEHCIDEDQDHTECCKDVECPECDFGTKDGDICLTCDGQGGVMICGKCKSKPTCKHQVGVEFEVEKKEECDCYTESESCFECGGEGTIITCVDDLCRNGEHCIHGDGEENCQDCNGEGEVNIPCSEHNKTLKFLPLRQKVDGDNSVLMVVPKEK